MQRVTKDIKPLQDEVLRSARARLDSLTKPPGSLGQLERLAERLSGIAGKVPPSFGRKAILVMAGDHGVCEEGVSAYPQSVTEQMVLNFLSGGAAVNVFAKHAGADVVCVDMGVAAELAHSALVVRKIGYGTANMTKGPAMTAEQTERAIRAGIDLVEGLASQGYGLLAIGEMGIGNTTAAAALTCSLLGVSPELSVGRGTGIDDEGLARKRDAVRRALDVNGLNVRAFTGADAVDSLSKVGGFEIAGMVGVCLGAGLFRVPVIIDGYISTAAALVAGRISPHVISYLIASHRSEEPGHSLILEELGLEPMLEFGMRLGEGTGAALCMRIVEASADVLGSMATFTSAGISGKLEAGE